MRERFFTLHRLLFQISPIFVGKSPKKLNEILKSNMAAAHLANGNNNIEATLDYI